ncbi:hemoglobin/transferrin/lactoferrin receptor protein [Flavobacterium haoranii]|uniref:Hemoglobin/transferrin/lactoferrin receptor protein n=2 Tax=Flavobacterium haoranii TaxID=683124 RepID=A0A1M6DHP1_9FLAO|nr:hemoglobin/transferrin/lactoferrin receptor protein [Flavobacterium haoranii]
MQFFNYLDLTKMKRIYTIILFVFSGIIYSQTEQDTIKVTTLDEVVVATKWKQKKEDLPYKIASISKEAIELQNPQTAADLLSVSGKVFIQKSQQGGGSPMIRGFATNRLLYTVDGVRMNTAIFRGGNIQNVISLDGFAMENVEVLFGPNSVIYGSDAIGGVMSFQTVKPKFSTNENTSVSGNVFSRFSSANDEKTGHFDVQLGWKKWASYTSISYNDFGDLRMGTHGPNEYLKTYYVVPNFDGSDEVLTNENALVQKPSAYTQYNVTQKVRFAPNENWDFQYGFHYSETSDYSRYDRHLRMRNGLPRYAEWNYGPQKWMMNALEISNFAKGNLYDEMTIRFAYQNFEESRISRNLNNVNREIRIEKVDAYSFNIDFNKKIGTKNKLFYGVEYVFDKVNSEGIDEDITSGVQVEGPARYPQADWQSIGIYLNDQYTITDKVLLSAGLRYNQYILNAEFDTTFYPFPFTEAKLNDGALTGSLGVVYKPSNSWVLSSNVSTAFRSPNVDDVGKVFDSEPGSVVVPNPNLKAEYAYNVDFNIAKVFGSNFKLDLSTYYTWLEDALVRRDYTLNGSSQIMYDGELSQVQAIQNAAKATVYGVQFGVEAKLSKDFVFSTDLNFQKGEEELDNGEKSPSRHAAPFFGVSRLTFTHEKLELQIYTQYSAKKDYEDLPEEERGKPEIYAIDGNGNPYSPGWYTLNLKTDYKFNKTFNVTAGLENITDQRYRPYSSGLVAPGRNFIVGVRAKF